MFKIKVLFVVLCGLIWTCNSQPANSGKEKTVQQEPGQATPIDFPAIANKLIQQADLPPGEKVMMVGKSGRFDGLVPLLKKEILEKKAIYLGTFEVTPGAPNKWETEFTSGAASLDRAPLTEYLQSVDLGIMLPGATPADLPYAAMQDLLWTGKGRTIHFHWEGAYDLDGNPISVNSEIDAFYQKVVLETDYAALAKKQQQFENAMRGARIRVTTPAGTDIVFEIGDRPVTRQDGDVTAKRMKTARNLIDREIELPAGAIRVAPVESSVNGSIAFPPSEWGGQKVEGLIMHFKNGKLSEFSCIKGRSGVENVLEEAGESARSFREFALGFNPDLSISAAGGKWIPYYGYGAGVVRLSLGDNRELGGNVGGGFVRWNFFNDATVRIGNTTWVKDGVLLEVNIN